MPKTNIYRASLIKPGAMITTCTAIGGIKYNNSCPSRLRCGICGNSRPNFPDGLPCSLSQIIFIESRDCDKCPDRFVCWSEA